MGPQILTNAAEVLSDHSLCDPCLGRIFGALGHGLNNRERGESIRTLLCMAKDMPKSQIQPSGGPCDICGGLYSSIPRLAGRAWVIAKNYEFRTYLFGTTLHSSVVKNQRRLAETYDLSDAENPGHALNRELGKRFEKLAGSTKSGLDLDLNHPDIKVEFDFPSDCISISVKPLYLYGRYRKLARDVSQTEWLCPVCGGRGCAECGGSGYRYPFSVEKSIAGPLIQRVGASDAKFHGAGREDVDVLMKGKGRPFVMELLAPHRRRPNLDGIREEVTAGSEGKVRVRGLKWVRKSAVSVVKQARLDKLYRARVRTDAPLPLDRINSALGELQGEVQQRTPHRVDHRRADKVRIRRLYHAQAAPLENREYLLTLHCESGLYVKELLTSDSGRTEPSLAGQLEVSVEVLELDVLKVLGSLEEGENHEYRMAKIGPTD